MSHAFWTNCLFSTTCLCLLAGACSMDRVTPRFDGHVAHRAGINRMQGEIVVVRSGDTLRTIAERNRVSVKELMITNDLISTRVRPGQELYLPPFP